MKKLILIFICVYICLLSGCSALNPLNTEIIVPASYGGSSQTENENASSQNGHGDIMSSVYDFGAAGDGIHDDTAAIQKAVDSDMPVYFPKGVYVVSRPIVITNKYYWSLYAQDATFYNTGSDYTFRIESAENCHINIGQINAMNGGGIEFFSDGDTNWNQYITLVFNCIECRTDCIHVKVLNKGWSNENQVYGGRFKAGQNGVNVEQFNNEVTNGWKFYNCGIEGVSNGFLFNAGSSSIDDMVIVNARYEELYETILKTEGAVFNCLWIGTSVVRATEIKCSEQTNRFEIIAPIEDHGHRGCIIDGKLMVEEIKYTEASPG